MAGTTGNRRIRGAPGLAGILMLQLMFPAAGVGLAGTEEIPADRWLEIDLYWFDREAIGRSVEEFWDRYAPLYEGVTGWKGLIMSIGLSAGYILDWHGKLDEAVSLPQNMRPWPMLECSGQLEGTTEERIRQWKEERLAKADRSRWASYQPWTYGELKILAETLRKVAREKYEIQGFKVGSYVTGWDRHYGCDPIDFSVKHPNSFFRVRVNGRVFNHLAVLDADETGYGAYPGGIPAGTAVVEFFGKQWGHLSRTVGLDALLMKDCFFQPEAYQKSGPFGWNAPEDPAQVEAWHQATAKLVRTSKQSNPDAIVIGQSSAFSAIADWRVQCLDLERLAREGYMDAYLDQTWSGAYAEVGVRHVRFWNVPWLGWTHQLTNVLVHAATLAGTGVRHYVLTETFDAWEDFDILRSSPERLRWGIWAYLHAGVKTPQGLKFPEGSYVSWANRGRNLLSPDDVAFLRNEINAATLDARRTTGILGPTLVYCRSALKWQSENQPARSIKEWIDEQAGTLIKWPVPILSATRLEWIREVKSDLFILQTPVHLTQSEEDALLQLADGGQPVAVFGSPVGGVSPALSRRIGIHSDDQALGPLEKSASLGTVSPEVEELVQGIPESFPILHLPSRNRAESGAVAIYQVAGTPALVINNSRGRRLVFWDPPELVPEHPWVDKPFVEFIGSAYPYVLAARALNRQLAGTASPRASRVEPDEAVNLSVWQLQDGTYRLLAGNLEEGLRHDADFSRRVRVLFPEHWTRGGDLFLLDSWGQGNRFSAGSGVEIELGQAESKLFQIVVVDHE